MNSEQKPPQVLIVLEGTFEPDHYRIPAEMIANKLRREKEAEVNIVDSWNEEAGRKTNMVIFMSGEMIETANKFQERTRIRTVVLNGMEERVAVLPKPAGCFQAVVELCPYPRPAERL